MRWVNEHIMPRWRTFTLAVRHGLPSGALRREEEKMNMRVDLRHDRMRDYTGEMNESLLQ